MISIVTAPFIELVGDLVEQLNRGETIHSERTPEAAEILSRIRHKFLAPSLRDFASRVENALSASPTITPGSILAVQLKDAYVDHLSKSVESLAELGNAQALILSGVRKAYKQGFEAGSRRSATPSRPDAFARAMYDAEEKYDEAPCDSWDEGFWYKVKNWLATFE